MSNKRNANNNVHFNPAVKDLTIDLWLSGKSEYEIEKAIRSYLYHARQRRGHFHENMKTAS